MPPYHPASIGMVERAVQTFKNGMKKMKEGTVQTNLLRFLFNFLITPHSSTGMLPAELLFGRRLNSHLDNLKSSLGEKIQQNQKEQKQDYMCMPELKNFRWGTRVEV